MKYLIALIALQFTINCTSQTIKEQFMGAINQQPLNNNVTYSYDGFGNNIKVHWPNVYVAEEMVTLTDRLINDPSSLAYGTTLGECGKYDIVLKVKTYNYNFLSIEQAYSSMFCPIRDDMEFETFNFFYANDGVVYTVGARRNGYVDSQIDKFLLTADKDCNYDKKYLRPHLVFENNVPRLYISKDKVCTEYALQPLDITKLDLIFTPVTYSSLSIKDTYMKFN